MSSTGAPTAAAHAATSAYVPEQPVAPYLDAVVEYAFRGAARYHVPGIREAPEPIRAWSRRSGSTRWPPTSRS